MQEDKGKVQEPKRPQLVSPEPDSTPTASRGFSQVTEIQGSFLKIIIIINDIQKGWVSDPQGVSLYVYMSRDKNGLNRYHTLRGTNDAESSIHKQIHQNFSALNASPILADCVMADWHHQYNTEIGSLNQEGKRYMILGLII